jgi:predicted RNase H-like nuclease (RuvC/YqgF family)
MENNMTDNIKQLAIAYAGDRTQGAGHGWPGYGAELIQKGYIAGYTACAKSYEKELEDAATYNKQLQDKVDDLNDIIKDLRDELGETTEENELWTK